MKSNGKNTEKHFGALCEKSVERNSSAAAADGLILKDEEVEWAGKH